MIKFFIYLPACILFLSGTVLAENELIFGGIEKSVNHRIGAAILKEAYHSIGYRVSFVTLPTKRTLHDANAGKLDGEVQRVDGIDREYPNLVRIPTPLFTHVASVYSKNADIKIDGWESLKPYSVGIRSGVKYAERGTRGMDRIAVDSFEQLIRILQKGRVDCIVGSQYAFDLLIQKLDAKDILRIDPPISLKPLYHYLHKKNGFLVEDIDKAIKRMNRSGRNEEIRMHVLKNPQRQ